MMGIKLPLLSKFVWLWQSVRLRHRTLLANREPHSMTNSTHYSMNRKYILSLLAGLLCTTSAVYAQYSVARPSSLYGAHQWRSASTHESTATTQATLRLDPLEQAEIDLHTLSNTTGLKPMKFAQTRQIGINPEEQGEWLISQDGLSVWRLTIVSPGAQGVGLKLTDYNFPEGAALYVHGKDGRLRGAFTSLNNSDSGVLYLAPVLGEEITIIYEAPRGHRGKALPFSVQELHHDYVGLRGMSASKLGFEQGEPFYDFKSQGGLASLVCSPNVVGIPERWEQSRSVVLLMINGSLAGTGTLINNTRNDGSAYVLTAAHNINNLYENTQPDEVADLARSIVLFFGFQSPMVRGNVRGTEEMTLSGTEVLVYDEQSDMALLRITGLPKDEQGRTMPIPEAYNAYFAGWNLSEKPLAPYFGIHHPLSSTKRYNLAHDKQIATEDYTIGYNLSWQNIHWSLKRWEIGTTAAGSSGSPLFDKDGLIIGGLTGGRSTCSTPVDDHYFALCRATRTDAGKHLLDYLDPAGTSGGRCEGFDPNKQEQVYRLSAFTPRVWQESSPVGVLPLSESTEIGRPIRLDSDGTTPLGAYLVFKGSVSLSAVFPTLQVNLRPISGGGSIGDILWSTQVPTAQFARYDRESKDFSHGSRTVSLDTVELFIPSATTTLGKVATIPQGEYLLTLSSPQPISLPILYEPQQSAKSGGTVWSKLEGGWQQTPASVWIDLLVKSPNKATQGSEAPQARGYYYGDKLYIFLRNDIAQGMLHIYNLSGVLVYQQRLGAMENVAYLSREHLPTGLYVASITTPRGNQSFKFVKQ